MPVLMPILRRRFVGLLLLLSCLSLPAGAGSVYFGLSRDSEKLTLINHGNTTAFHPQVLRLVADGRWEEMRPVSGAAPVDMPSGAQLEFHWRTATGQVPGPEHFGPFAASLPVMVRFFDQAGAGFGQISFFDQPPPGPDLVRAYYEDGQLIVAPLPSLETEGVRASWLLWPQEEGIRPLVRPVRLEHAQPPAQRIAWRPGMAPLRFDLGAGLPAPFLLHETSRGIELQRLPSGNVQGRQQRSAWLEKGGLFYRLALVALVVAALGAILAPAGIRREGSA